MLFLFPPSLGTYQKDHSESEAEAVTEMRKITQKYTGFSPMWLLQLCGGKLGLRKCVRYSTKQQLKKDYVN